MMLNDIEFDIRVKIEKDDPLHKTVSDAMRSLSTFTIVVDDRQYVVRANRMSLEFEGLNSMSLSFSGSGQQKMT